MRCIVRMSVRVFIHATLQGDTPMGKSRPGATAHEPGLVDEIYLDLDPHRATKYNNPRRWGFEVEPCGSS